MRWANCHSSRRWAATRAVASLPATLVCSSASPKSSSKLPNLDFSTSYKAFCSPTKLPSCGNPNQLLVSKSSRSTSMMSPIRPSTLSGRVSGSNAVPTTPLAYPGANCSVFLGRRMWVCSCWVGPLAAALASAAAINLEAGISPDCASGLLLSNTETRNSLCFVFIWQ